MIKPALRFFGGLGLLLLALLAGLQLTSCRTERPADLRPYRPANYRSRAQCLRSSAIRQREADAETLTAREAQRRARFISTTY